MVADRLEVVCTARAGLGPKISLICLHLGPAWPWGLVSRPKPGATQASGSNPGLELLEHLFF